MPVAWLLLLLVGYLIWHVGFGPVFSAVFRIGWPGFSLLCGLGFILFALLGYCIIPRLQRAALGVVADR